MSQTVPVTKKRIGVNRSDRSRRNKRGPQLDADWQARYLKAYRELGAIWKAARAAGVDRKTVQRYAESDPEFREAMEDARQEFADQLEVELRQIGIDKSNPLAYFALLKKHRPSEFIDKQVNLSVSANVEDATAEDVRSMLAQFAGNVTPATLKALREPLAITATVDSGHAEGVRP